MCLLPGHHFRAGYWQPDRPGSLCPVKSTP
jgi:hypothetical protein